MIESKVIGHMCCVYVTDSVISFLSGTEILTAYYWHQVPIHQNSISSLLEKNCTCNSDLSSMT